MWYLLRHLFHDMYDIDKWGLGELGDVIENRLFQQGVEIIFSDGKCQLTYLSPSRATDLCF